MHTAQLPALALRIGHSEPPGRDLLRLEFSAKGGGSRLRPVEFIRSKLAYDLMGLPGAMTLPWLAETAILPLRIAAENVMRISGGRASLLLWDAYRSRPTQRAIFDNYTRQLKTENPDWSAELLLERTRDFVSDPKSVFPHGTGGAVDVTLLVNGREADLGSEFDEFTERAARTYFEDHPPADENEQLAALYRSWLMDSFDQAGWAGIDSEWWHYEYATTRWAIARNAKATLIDIVDAPVAESATEKHRAVPRLQPMLEDGVGPDFAAPGQRAAGLAHSVSHYYYARSDHSAANGLASALIDLTDADRAVLFPSGKAACVGALDALVPENGRCLCDSSIYYEVQAAIKEMERFYGRWTLRHVDFTDDRSLMEALRTFMPDVVYLDNPRNWVLDTFDIAALRNRMESVGKAILVVDVTLQPLQLALSKGADVAVLSLSKYPSNGVELGGATLSKNPVLDRQLRDYMDRRGIQIGLSSAHAIWKEVVSLRDRMEALSSKATKIGQALQQHAAVRRVRIPESDYLDGLVGGQVSFHLADASMGRAFEKIMGHNAPNRHCALRLACTFGASISTVEHFASNPRKRDRLAREETNEVMIPNDLVRIGVGSRDSADSIIDWLMFGLDGVAKG